MSGHGERESRRGNAGGGQLGAEDATQHPRQESNGNLLAPGLDRPGGIERTRTVTEMDGCGNANARSRMPQPD
eukprot:1119862-Rhodomonas_salina.1